MKVKRRKFNIFELMELELEKNREKGPVEEFVLTVDEFKEFRLNAHNRSATFQKIDGRQDDEIGGDWYYKGALVVVNGKLTD